MRVAVYTSALVGALACAGARPAPHAAAAASSPAEALAVRTARLPERYKMVHQVMARYAGNTYVMTGYMLGRRDGSFRVSASADVGPPLFDVAKVGGAFQTRVHYAPLAERLDPLHIARAIDRIFGAECSGPGEPHGDRFVYACPREGDDEADAMTMELDAATLALARKTFSRGGVEQLTVVYEEPKLFGAEWVPTRIHLRDVHGYSLDIAVSEYVPGFAFSDERLSLPAP